jgi:hypothetical protein
MKLIFIHGRAQEGKDPKVLQDLWQRTLEKGFQKAGLTWPPGVRVEFPFYGDTLDKLVHQLNSPLVDDVIKRGAEQDTTEAEFRGELLYEIAQGSGIKDADIQAKYIGDVQAKGPQNWEWVQAILKSLDNTPIGGPVLDLFTRDVYVYLTNRNVRKAIDAVVAPFLTEDPCVVVGHSLGTVVGYNVLRKASPQVEVKRYVTVGSPLGLKAIKQRLDTPLEMPRGTRDWYNAFDERDVVALHPLDGNNFPITPAIKNKSNVDNHTDNHHRIVGYLDDVDVARQIHSALYP